MIFLKLNWRSLIPFSIWNSLIFERKNSISRALKSERFHKKPFNLFLTALRWCGKHKRHCWYYFYWSKIQYVFATTHFSSNSTCCICSMLQLYTLHLSHNTSTITECAFFSFIIRSQPDYNREINWSTFIFIPQWISFSFKATHTFNEHGDTSKRIFTCNLGIFLVVLM